MTIIAENEPPRLAGTGENDSKRLFQVNTHLLGVKLPGISSEVIATANIRHIESDEAFELCGLREPGVWLPYHNLNGSPVIDSGRQYGRLRLDNPRDDRKYHQRHGTTQHAYIPAHIAKMPVGADLHLIEGEKKSLALNDAGFWAIGVGGFYGFANKCEDGFEFLQELQAVFDAKKPARIFFVGDNDTALNFEFSRAALRFVSMAPCPVLLPRIPLSSPKGADDCRAAMGDGFRSFWDQLLNSAIAVDPKGTVENLALQLLEMELPVISATTGSARQKHVSKIIAMGTVSASPLYLDELVRFGAELGYTRKAFRDEITRAKKDHKQTCAGDEEIVAQYGPPATIGEKVTHFNQAYWAALYRKQNAILFEPSEREFFRYKVDNGLWEPHTKDAIGTRLDAILKDASASQPELGTYRDMRHVRDVIAKMGGQAEVRNAFVKSRNFVHLANCVLIFENGNIIGTEFSPDYYSRNASPFVYDKNATCPEFETFISGIFDQNDVELFQEWFGLALLGINLPQVILLIHGIGETGKSQLAIVVRKIIGEINCTELRTNLLDERFETYRYRNRSLLVGSDVAGDFLSTRPAQRLKALTGGDLIEPEGKGLNGGTNIRGTFNVLITSNERLRVRLEGESDISAWKRRLIILESIGKPVSKPIDNYGEYLAGKEGSGILNFALIGLQQYFARGIARMPLGDEQKARVDRLLRESQSLEHFVKECLVKQDDCNVTTSELIEGYAQWAAASGYAASPITIIERMLPGLMLEHHHVTKSNCIPRDGKSVRGYFGIKMQGSI